MENSLEFFNGDVKQQKEQLLQQKRNLKQAAIEKASDIDVMNTLIKFGSLGA